MFYSLDDLFPLGSLLSCFLWRSPFRLGCSLCFLRCSSLLFGCSLLLWGSLPLGLAVFFGVVLFLALALFFLAARLAFAAAALFAFAATRLAFAAALFALLLATAAALRCATAALRARAFPDLLSWHRDGTTRLLLVL